MISIEKIKKESAEKLERDVKLVAEKNVILDAVTGNKILSALQIAGVSEHVYRANYTLKIIVAEDEEAQNICKSLDDAKMLLPVVKIDNGCVSFGPRISIEEKEETSAEITDIGPWYAKISRCMPYQSEVSWIAYVTLAEFTVQLQIVVTRSEMNVGVEEERTEKGRILKIDGQTVYRWLGVTNQKYFSDLLGYSGTNAMRHYIAYNR